VTLAQVQGSPGPAAAVGSALGRRGLSPGARYLLLRICFVPIGALAVATLSFFFVNLIPSDPVRAFLGSLATPAQILAAQRKLGLDQPVWDRYISYMNGLFHGSLGNSYYGGQPVIDAIGQRITSSAELIVPAFILAYLIGVTLGGIGAYYKDRAADRVAGVAVALTQSIPDYVIGLLGVFYLFYVLHVLPAPTGQLSLIIIPPPTVTNASFVDALIAGNGPAITDSLQHLIMPVLALGIANSVVFARITRAAMTRSLASAHIEFARARGLREWQVVRQAFRVSRIPVITYSATVIATLIGGDAIVEQVFNWQGIGQWGVAGLLRSDLPVVQGFVLLSGVVTLLAYLVADLIIFRADPRIRRPQGREGNR
jgi:ABC-type dipeptide/oligopeptide/nickel transport system permease component